jgi:hypothetical protein
MERGPRVFRSTVVKPYHVDPLEEHQEEGHREQEAHGDGFMRTDNGEPVTDQATDSAIEVTTSPAND